MLRLKEVTIDKYKCFSETQTFSIDPKVTVLVGMNEAGKSALLEAIAKTNYFDQRDPSFKFNKSLDYPRKEKKKYDKSGVVAEVVKCRYTISKELTTKINTDLGFDLFSATEFTYIKRYDNSEIFEGTSVSLKNFFLNKLLGSLSDNDEVLNKLLGVKNSSDLNQVLTQTEDEKLREQLKGLVTYFQNTLKFENPLEEYIVRKWIKPNIPKFLYYSEYYALPSRINLQDLCSNRLSDESAKTVKALLELADVNLNEILHSTEYEPYIAELEATSNEITDILFKYWKTNQNSRIRFEIDKQLINNTLVLFLEVRVENQNYWISLPLKNRSKGFNWFFSFIVWFSKIQEDKNSKYILLLDEPGLNLHAAAQANLLEYIEDLSSAYQVIYTTHSPFMVDALHLDRVRTIVETEKGSKVSDSIQEKDPNTLFPLQAALGYDIAQNLFISSKNLLVEGPADLVYLEVMSNLLEENGRTGLRKEITIVPVGGLDKVSTFISLLRGNKLEIACLLDSAIDPKSKAKMEDLTRYEIIKSKNIRFFDEFTPIKGGKAEIEDMFEKTEYLKIFNSAFEEYDDINVKDIKNVDGRIIDQISRQLGIERFNHYRPAKVLLKMGVDKDFFASSTLDRFEKMFTEVNKLF